MKKIIADVALVCWFVTWTSAVERSDIDEAWVLNQVFQKAMQYAGSIACDVRADKKNVVALVPWNDFRDMIEREKAKYALIWYGDIGCSGGSGSVNPYITVIQISTGNSFVANLSRSSPLIKFETQIRDIRVIEAAENELILNGLDGAPDDPICCPTIPVRVHLRQDSQGNWKLIEKTMMGE